MIQAIAVQKEDIPGLKFRNISAEKDANFHSNLRSDLHRALLLGNASHQKVKIIFETSEGRMVTDTTVWNLTENYIILKGNVDIPIHSILGIDFFE
ncbi:MAG: hypothetical protein EYC69_05080 [Bacteroidetes bacterium]|nr:MAG: hypothetical protein EYC69_05080 [Bacteroidota bacterium]